MIKLGLNPDEAVIHVRDKGGTYVARAQGLNITASCTGGAYRAAAACAAKVWPQGFDLKPSSYSMTFIGSAKKAAELSTLNGEVPHA